MPKLRLMHFINQFFAGAGGEEKADALPQIHPGPLGPGKRLQALLGESARIEVTVYCGDNYIAAHPGEALKALSEAARKYNVQLMIAGPAFASGRYGYACAEVCHGVNQALGIPCVAAMSPDNPGIKAYKEYRDAAVFCLPTKEALTGMEEALSSVARFTLRLAGGAQIGPAAAEGYIPRGIRIVEKADKSCTQRAIDMMLNKLAGRPFTSEIPLPEEEAVPITPPVASLKDALLAIVSTGGVVPPGNPDGFKTFRNTQWRKYSIATLNSMQDIAWGVVHGGYDNTYMQANPNYGIPLDVCRELEKAGVFSRLYPFYYLTPGVVAAAADMQRIGREMARDLKAEGVSAVLLVST